jgi:hypothetical protein
MTQLLIVVLALLILNSLWFSPRFLFVVPLKQHKTIAWGVLELLCWYFILGGLARLAEFQSIGQLAPQNWEFYAITVCLLVVFAAPGFIVRYLWK